MKLDKKGLAKGISALVLIVAMATLAFSAIGVTAQQSGPALYCELNGIEGRQVADARLNVGTPELDISLTDNCPPILAFVPGVSVPECVEMGGRITRCA